ncbi:CPBP family intramembrane glutamic endopeptidase [Sphingomonas sp. 1P06PA]|uniref:CPBP family intramembrane glutamic endopeptidase n=1 Tax=Sphingomonas sp. 1P06PA TaxID=554121 RepID=UPI0039A4CFF8
MTTPSEEADVLAEMFGSRTAGRDRTVRIDPAAAAAPATPRSPKHAHLIAAASLIVAIAIGSACLTGGIAVAGHLALSIWPAGDGDPPLVEALYICCIFVPMALAALIGGRLTATHPLAAGRRPWAMAGLGALMGATGVVIATGYAVVAGATTTGAGALIGPALAIGAVLVLIQSGTEELFLRGWLQPVLSRAWGGWIAVLLSALVFAGLHLLGGGRSPVTMANLMLGGILFGLLAWRGGGIVGAVAAHYSWNMIEGLVLGLDPNPGVGSFGALWDIDLVGNPLWGGSDEGLNASIAMTIVLVALVVPLATRARTVK